MNYTEITELALSYADRQDDEVTSRIDQFISLVESRINRKLKVLDMSARSVVDLTTTNPDQKYFQLPDDFGGLRDIQVNKTDDAGNPSSFRTLSYVNPEQMNNLENSGAQVGQSQVGRKIFYTIIARQIQIYPPQEIVAPAGGTLEITYYQRVPPLTSTDPNNWISDEFPDAYIHGILVEISSFVKDRDAFAIWKGRFDESLAEIQTEDADVRWSGTPLTMRAG